MSVVFEDEQLATNLGPRVVENHEFPYLARLLISMHVAHDEKSATRLLVIIAILFFVLSFVLFAFTFVRRTDNYFGDRQTGAYTPAAPAASKPDEKIH